MAQTTRTSTCERFVFADAADFAAFQHAQQFGLHRLGQLADFVEEQRAAVGDFEQADAMFVGAGEAAFAMAEQFAFDQAFGQCAAVDGHERLFGAVALIVHAAGDQFLAGAGFAGDQHGGFGRGHFGDELFDAVDAGRFADQLRRAFDAFKRCCKARHLLREFALLADAVQQGFDFDELAGFGQIVERTVAQRGDGGIERRFAGEDDGFGVGRKFLALGDDLRRR